MAEANWAYGAAQGLAAAANSGVASIDAKLKEDADARAENRQLDMKTRLLAVEESMRNRAEDRKRALAVQQGQAIGTAATGLLQSGVATSINSRFGSSIDPNDPQSAETLKAIRANPDASKAYGLDPEDDLAKAKARADAARNLGDLPAAGEEDKNVRNLVQDKRNAKTDESTNHRLDITETFQRNLQERQQTLAEATLAHQRVMESHANSRDTAANSRAEESAKREQRAATAKALDGANADIKALEKDAADMMADEGRRKVAQTQLQAARAEAAGYRRALAGAGVDAVDAPDAPRETPTKASNDKVLGDPTLKDAYVKRFGQEAYDAIAKKAPAAAAPSASVAPPKAGGLLSSEPEYTPPPESPAGQLAARTSAARQASDQATQQRLGSAQTLASKALASNDPAAAQEAQDAPGFSLLPRDIQSKIFALVRGK